MENQHRKITGYRELSQTEIDLMNEIKAKGAELEDLIVKVKLHLTNQITKAHEQISTSKFALENKEAIETVERHDQATPARWANMAATDFQIALMKLTRAVAQPTSF